MSAVDEMRVRYRGVKGDQALGRRAAWRPTFPNGSGHGASRDDPFGAVHRHTGGRRDLLSGHVLEPVRADAAQQLLRKRVHDVMHAATMLENGIARIYAFDSGFLKVPGITVLRP